ncbi:DNA-directed DNA polymerase [Tanacetum coccineum]
MATNGTTTNFKIQSNTIAILPTFQGRSNEEPYTHLCEFFSIVDKHEVTCMTKDGVRLRLFPFSLKDQAKEWFSSLEPGSINSWVKMQSKFFDEFYSISKTADIRSRIKSFRQLPGEQFHEAFNRLKELLRTCPHHDVPKWELVKVFYDGLDSNNQQFVVATSGGVYFFSRPMEEEWDFFERLSKGSPPPSEEHVNRPYGSRPRNDPFSESYNPGWRNHPNFWWRNEDDTRPNNGQQYNSGYKPRYDSGGLSNYQQQQHSYQQRTQQQYQNHGQGQALERQVGQSADKLSKRDDGKLPSYTNLNPTHKKNGNEHVNMVTSLCSDKKNKPEHILVEELNNDKNHEEPLKKSFENKESPKVGRMV